MHRPQPADLAAELRHLLTVADRRDALLRALITRPVDPEAQIAAITDPVERAVAATRALAVAGQLRAIRDRDIHQLAGRADATNRPATQGAAAGRLVGVTRSRANQILNQAPPDPPDPAQADLVVAAVLTLDDPALRLRAVRLALIDHCSHRPALTALQHTAVRSAIAGGHITQAALADRLGKHRTWPTSTVGLPEAAKRGRGRTSLTAPDRRRTQR
jgi:hypothetical protein